MLNCKQEVETRVEWIKNLLKTTGAKGIVYGNSGGKDCTLVGILSKMATDNVTGIIMPCESSRNFGIDREHAILVGANRNRPDAGQASVPERAFGQYRRLRDGVCKHKSAPSYDDALRIRL